MCQDIEVQVEVNRAKSEQTNQSVTEAWKTIDWRKCHKKVFKLQKRIYAASRSGDVRKVRQLQKTLMRSWSGKVLAVRRVTQDNQGKCTAGVDGVKSLTPKQRYELAGSLKLTGKSQPTRRVWIPKPGKDEQRPLGIPTIYDRALQALVKLTLEPEWEARFEASSYGFRPGRSCQDAITHIKAAVITCSKYVLDADIAQCFDRIDHQKLLQKLGMNGLVRQQIKAWIKSGVIDKGALTTTSEGTQQGGVISPLLANIALHGLETAVKDYVMNLSAQVTGRNMKQSRRESVQIIRYADDFIVMHKNLSVVQGCREVISEWLSDIGLALKPEKTRLTHTLRPELSELGNAGFDFLGFHIQQYPVGRATSDRDTRGKPTGFDTLIFPTKKALKVHQQRLGEIIANSKSKNQAELIKELNPVIKGWANFYRWSDVKTIGLLSKQDYLLYLKLRRWGKRRCHGSAKDAHDRYWHKHGNQNWVFSTDKGKYALRLLSHIDVSCSSTNYVKVKADKSPFDGDLVYWSSRTGLHPELSNRTAKLLKRQQGQCTYCGLTFQTGDVMEVDHITPKTKGGKDESNNLQLLHRHCHDKKTLADGSLKRS